ncbi:MAG: hypothetical protein HY674_17780, partial [Chloroflexi bacterium]|nr:hypothetical protein [Chloroflexota bacterium]
MPSVETPGVTPKKPFHSRHQIPLRQMIKKSRTDRTKRTPLRGRGGGRWNLANEVVGATADLAARASISRVKKLLFGGRRVLFEEFCLLTRTFNGRPGYSRMKRDKQNMEILPKKFYERLKPLLGHVPSRLAGLSLKCRNCQDTFQPDLLAKRPPLKPVTPNSGKGLWIPIGATVRCPKCRTENNLPLPVVKQTGRYLLCGDEAYRDDLPGISIITYSLVGTNFLHVEAAEQLITQYKSQRVPDADPSSWKIHMKEIWAPHHRQRHPVFSKWSGDFVNDFVSGLLDLFSRFETGFVKLNVSAVYHKEND